jgi:hypothetical protein
MTTYYNLQKYLIPIIVPTENLDYETRLRLFGYTIEDLKTIITPWELKVLRQLVQWVMIHH